MVKFVEIHSAIVRKIREKVGNEIKITSEDITKGFTRPSFFLTFDDVKTSNFMNEALDTFLTVRIYYFSENEKKNKIENLTIQDMLSEIFLQENNLIEINNEVSIEVDDLEFQTIDSVLHCYFDINICENYQRVDDTTQEMEDLFIDNDKL